MTPAHKKPQQIMAGLFSEINRLSNQVTALEGAILDLVANSAKPPKEGNSKNLQQIDMLNQSIHALAKYIQALDSVEWSDRTIDITAALQHLPLDDMRTRLLNGAVEHQGDQPIQTQGNILFD